MKTIILSDTHLTDFVRQNKLRALKRVIESADKVIIAGDFWDSYITSFDRFIESGWKELFPLLKLRKAIYLYGNHDPKEAADERVKLFSEHQTDELWLKIGSWELLVQHGHKIVRHLDAYVPEWLITPFTTRLTMLVQLTRLRLFGRERSLQLFDAPNNILMRAWGKENLKSNQILVTGHNDYAEYCPNQQYICTGFNRYGYLSYLQIDDEKMELIKSSY